MDAQSQHIIRQFKGLLRDVNGIALYKFLSPTLPEEAGY